MTTMILLLILLHSILFQYKIYSKLCLGPPSRGQTKITIKNSLFLKGGIALHQ